MATLKDFRDERIRKLNELKEENIPYILASASIKENIDFYFETFALERWFEKENTVYSIKSNSKNFTGFLKNIFYGI